MNREGKVGGRRTVKNELEESGGRVLVLELRSNVRVIAEASAVPAERQRQLAKHLRHGSVDLFTQSRVSSHESEDGLSVGLAREQGLHTLAELRHRKLCSLQRFAQGEERDGSSSYESEVAEVAVRIRSKLGDAVADDNYEGIRTV